MIIWFFRAPIRSESTLPYAYLDEMVMMHVSCHDRRRQKSSRSLRMSLINIGVAPTASMRISRSAIETNPSLVQVTAVFAAFVMTLLATGCTQADYSQRTFFRDEY